MAMHPSTGKQVLVEKPRRGREILTRDVPEELIDKLGTISAKRELNEGEVVTKLLTDDKKVKLKPYHEGYVNEHKYLVPDSNLEAMKTLIDFKSKRRYGRRYLQEVDPESEKDIYNRYMDKYNRMYDRIHSEDEDEEEQEEEERIEEEEVKQEENEEEKVSEEEQIEEEKVEEESEVEDEEIEDENLEEEEEKEEEPIVETIMPPKEKPKSKDDNGEVHTLQFLLSGHIRQNMKPLFIVQLYKGKSPLDIENRETLSTYTQDNIDIYISGKFYKENILEEEDNKLKCLKIEHKEIKIDERSKVYEPQLSEIFSTEDVNILVTGRFHKNQRSNTFTPVFQFKVNKRGSLNEKGQLTKNKEQQKYVGRNEPENSSMSKGDAAKGNNVSVNHAMVHMPTHKWAQHSRAAYFRQEVPEQFSGIGDFDSARSVASKSEIDCFTGLKNDDASDFAGESPNSNSEFTKRLQTVGANEKREFTHIRNLNNTNKNYQKHAKQKITIYKRSALRRCLHTIAKQDNLTYCHHNCIQVNSSPEISTSAESHTGINVTAKESPKHFLKTKRLSWRRKKGRQLTTIRSCDSISNGNHPFNRSFAGPSSLLQDSSTVHPEPHIEEQAAQRLVTSKEAEAE